MVSKSEAKRSKNICSCCQKNVGAANLKKCSKCNLVRYCSRECQKQAWNLGHKKSCARAMPNSAASPDMQEMLVMFEKWLKLWRMKISSICFKAYNLSAQYPKDRLATHVFVLALKERSGKFPAKLSFEMDWGAIVPREEVLEMWDDIPSGLQDWYDDRRGDKTAQILILIGGHVRSIWFSVRELEPLFAQSYFGIHMGLLYEEAWPRALRKAIDIGNPEAYSEIVETEMFLLDLMMADELTLDSDDSESDDDYYDSDSE
ncbi:hypothetical protein DL96DRAFT_1810276 [Flagelloscypha sp. PMI_526]|nr:hypothetical protein DL96DRAFT_1810276 [Flagelloscypha sp. PMI_526]